MKTSICARLSVVAFTLFLSIAGCTPPTITPTWYLDADGDTYGNAAVTIQSDYRPDGYVADSSDCNDSDAAINPAASEVPDGFDNNCDGRVDEGSPPPDSELEAPPLSETAATSFKDATSFLYSGDNPVQTGVMPGTIDEVRVAVIRGRVLDRMNNPLSGVAVSIHDNAQFGQTLSRSDGMFDLAVNGGSTLTIVYTKDGYLPVQRKLPTRWRDYVMADDVVMIGLDPQQTRVDLSSQQALVVAQGSEQSDDAGTRQATLLIPQNTSATMTLPDGSRQSLSTITVRATEYTVGDNGFQAMPGNLPANSAYTYALELSVDEALETGATTVNFSQPLPFYVENFLDFPVGEAVPLGYYDRQQATWIAAENGRIIQVLAINNDMAVLDVDGSGMAATATQLAALNISDDERQALATLYSAGQSLWRVQIDHFTPWDCNWPYAPPDDAERPEGEVETLDDDRPEDSEDEDDCTGCVISPQGQTLAESIPIVGTPYSLHYQSDRMPGYKADKILSIPLSGESVPASLERIDLTINVAGQQIRETFAPSPNQGYQFEWDGHDGYGRKIYTAVNAHVTVSYVYPCVYQPGGNGFGQFASSIVPIGTRRNCQSMTLVRRSQKAVQSPFKSVVMAGVAGGWSLTVQHAWDAVRSRLALGDGRARGLPGGTIETVAGSGQSGHSGDGGSALEARMDNPFGLALDSIGNLYIADTFSHRIRRVSPDGIITTVAGTGVAGYAGDGGAASLAQLNEPHNIALDAQGNLYIADSENLRVRRVDPDGIITTVAGIGDRRGYSGDGGPAIAARLNEPRDVAVDGSGNLYIADYFNNRIRRVSRDGIISTVVGTGESAHSGDGGPADAAEIKGPQGIALDSAGNLYIADTDNSRIRRVGRDGIITTVAGTGAATYSGDGGPATQAQLFAPEGIAIDLRGNLYIADRGNHRIRVVGPEGVITTVAGTGIPSYSGDGGVATAAQLYAPSDVALDADGKLYLLDRVNKRVRRINFKEGVDPAEPRIASRDGMQQFQFNQSGLHLKTVNTVTGSEEHIFGRDEDGRLISITDAHGNVTNIERDASGVAQAIVAPDGQRTNLRINSDGFLWQVENPKGEIYEMDYLAATGLMTLFSDRRQQNTSFDYDTLGRLIEDSNAGNGGWTISREDLDSGYEITMTSAQGRVAKFKVEPQANGDRKQLNTHRDGTLEERLFTRNGSEITTSPDGTVTTRQQGPDPRFAMQSPVPALLEIATPGGLTQITNVTRSAVLTDSSDPLSVESLSEITTVNGRVYETVYDAATRTYTTSTPESRTSSTVLTEKGLPQTATIQGIEPVAYGYDVRGRLETVTTGTGTQQRQTRMTYYDSGYQQGMLASITDAENRTVTMSYDEAGRMTSQTLPGDRQVQYSYDANGNLISLTPPGRPAHVFNYNAFDLADDYTPPAVSGVAEPATVYNYNLDKQLELIARPDGKTIDYVYHASRGQLDRMTIPRGNYRYSYDGESGRLSAITAPDGGQLSFTYDGFLYTGQSWAGQVAGTVSREFNNDFNITTQAINGADEISYSYDNDALLSSAGALSISRNSQQGGLISATSLGDTATSQSYNGFGEVQTFSADYDTSTLFAFTIEERDKLGRITRRVETIGGSVTTETYSYDQAGRLETVTRNGIATTYGYDANGNRLSKASGGDEVFGEYDSQDRLTQYDSCAYTYSDNGELTSRSCGTDVTGFEHDVLGNLLSVQLPNDGMLIEYLVDGMNRRIGKKIDGVLVQGFLYQDQLNPVAELDADNNVVARFVYADKPYVPAYMQKGGQTYRIISDHLGSVRLVVNAEDGSIAQRIDYDEFGKVTLDTNPGFQPFGFAGGVYDRHTQLVRFGARDYDAEVGRWIQKDPIGFAGGFNFFDYVLQDPVNRFDPYGLAPSEVGLSAPVISAIGGGLIAVGISTGKPAVVVTGLGFAVVGGALFLWDAATTPAEQLNDARERIDEMEQEIERIRDLQDRLNRLNGNVTDCD